MLCARGLFCPVNKQLCSLLQEDLLCLLPNPNALVAVSKGMTAAKLSSHEIHPVLDWDCWLTRGVARRCGGEGRTGRHLLGAVNGRKLFFLNSRENLDCNFICVCVQ